MHELLCDSLNFINIQFLNSKMLKNMYAFTASEELQEYSQMKLKEILLI